MFNFGLKSDLSQTAQHPWSVSEGNAMVSDAPNKGPVT